VQTSVPMHRLRADRRGIPEATVARLPLYLRVLVELADSGVTTVSYGTRGVGYEVDCLSEEISRELGVTGHRAVAIVGVGNLGHALAGYGGFSARGFRIAGLFDADPARCGELVAGMRVRPMDDLEQAVASERVSIGVIATPAAAAQHVCDRLVGCGVTSVLNFASTVLSVPTGVDVRKVDLAVELQILSFHETRKSRAALSPTASTDVRGVLDRRAVS
jgi:redox-sensing transcriptional repressor